MYKVYILISEKFAKTYVGFTDNLDRRLIEHNSGKSEFSSRYKPWKILYFEDHEKLENAVSREKYFKTSAGRNKIKTLFVMGRGQAVRQRPLEP